MRERSGTEPAEKVGEMRLSSPSRATALAWFRGRRRVVVATLVEVLGSAPLEPGAEMLIEEQGNVEGSITGGCVESAVVMEAEQVFAGGPPRLVTYGISDELAGTVGLTCGGTVRVFVHELSSDAAEAVAAAFEDAVDGRPAAIATLLDGEAAGAKLVLAGGRVFGSLGGPELLDRNVAHDAAGLLDDGRTAIRRYGEDGSMLGDGLPVHIHTFAAPPQMLIFGAIDFSAAIAPIAKQVGYAVTICDAREPFIRSPRFSQAADIVVGWPDAAFSGRTLESRDSVLVFSHDPKFDEPALLGALATDVGYIGALGSRRTTVDRAARLRAAGVTEEQLARIHGPCGLDIGSRTPEETAISVLAEIIAERAARPGLPLYRTDGPIHTPQPGTTSTGVTGELWGIGGIARVSARY
jgi:xanthine dehydrogenase accessory factor